MEDVSAHIVRSYARVIRLPVFRNSGMRDGDALGPFGTLSYCKKVGRNDGR